MVHLADSFPQNNAIGFTGDPVPCTTGSGASVSMNSYRPSSITYGGHSVDEAMAVYEGKEQFAL